jgi:hypothetical protein
MYHGDNTGFLPSGQRWKNVLRGNDSSTVVCDVDCGSFWQGII